MKARVKSIVVFGLVIGLVSCAERPRPPGAVGTQTKATGSAGKIGVLLKVLVGKGVTPQNMKKALPKQLVTLRSGMVQGKPEVLVDVFVKSASSSLPQLKALGADIRTVTKSGIATATVPLNKVTALAAVSGVVRIEAATRVRKYNDNSNALTPVGANTVGMNNPRSSTGAGTIVGVVDSGIDWTHGDFIDNATGESRILFYWDQSDYDDDLTPAGAGWSFNYGHEYTKAQLDAALLADNTWDKSTNLFGPVDDPTYPIKASARDDDGHGTHVCGTAAGDGSASGKMGAAPAADIIFVKFDFAGDRNNDTAIVDAIDYIFKRGAEVGKPVVINLSLGSDFGPHDGTTLEERGISDLTGPGRLVVAAAGNPGNNNWSSRLSWGFAMHGSGALGSESITFRFPAYTPGSESYVFFDAWYEGGNDCRVVVRTPDGKQYPPYLNKNHRNTWVTGSPFTGFNTSEGAILVANGGDQLDWGTDNGDHEIYIEVSDYWGIDPAEGDWTFEIVAGPSGTCNGTFHAWYGASDDVILGWRNEAEPRDPTPKFGGRQTDNAYTIGKPASADEVIAVAAYQSRSSWSYAYGTDCRAEDDPGTQYYNVSPINYYDPYGMGELAYYSARGPRRDENAPLKPEIAAPGVGVTSALSHFVRHAEWPNNCTNYWESGPYHFGTNRVDPSLEATTIQGTSMASPNAAGGVALLLEHKTDMTAACLRKILETSARHDDATDTYANVANTAQTDTDANAGAGLPNFDWGHGKLDIADALTALAAYSTCTGECQADADCGTGTCEQSVDPCGCNQCVAGPDCSADGTCNTDCAPGDDPDCTTPPDCSADGTCNPACAPGDDPDCTCKAKDEPCQTGSDCCSGLCHPRKLQCK